LPFSYSHRSPGTLRGAISSCISRPLSSDKKPAPTLPHQPDLVLYPAFEPLHRYHQTQGLYWGFRGDLVLYLTTFCPPEPLIPWVLLSPPLCVLIAASVIFRVRLFPPPLALHLAPLPAPLSLTAFLPCPYPIVRHKETSTIGTSVPVSLLLCHEDSVTDTQ